MLFGGLLAWAVVEMIVINRSEPEWVRPAPAPKSKEIAAVVGSQRQHLGRAALAYVFPLLLVNVAGYLAGYGAASVMRLPDPMRRALTLEIGMQNAGVGTVLAVTYFPDYPTAAILPAASPPWLGLI